MTKIQISFERLKESHFPLMLEWLEKPHVKKWWDQEIVYTLDLVSEKFISCVEGVRDNKKIEGYITYVDEKPVAYLQVYNAYDFPRSKEIIGLPQSLGAIDIFIGDEQSLGQNLASKIISEFLAGDLVEFENCFVDPDINNIAAIKCYEKAGFSRVAEQKNINEVWMVRDNILEELKTREPIFHHPDKLGTTRQDIENQMCEEFWEVGASGNIYTREDVIKTLVARYKDPNYEDIWETSGFKLTQIAPDNYLITYHLIQNRTRHTKRSTLWRRVDGVWKILYHQGTVM